MVNLTHSGVLHLTCRHLRLVEADSEILESYYIIFVQREHVYQCVICSVFCSAPGWRAEAVSAPLKNDDV